MSRAATSPCSWWFFNGIVFSGAQTAVSVLPMAEGRDSGGGTPDHLPTALSFRAK